MVVHYLLLSTLRGQAELVDTAILFSVDLRARRTDDRVDPIRLVPRPRDPFADFLGALGVERFSLKRRLDGGDVSPDFLCSPPFLHFFFQGLESLEFVPSPFLECFPASSAFPAYPLKTP